MQAMSQPGMTDAGFFSLVHHVLHAHRSSESHPDERQRHRYSCLQLVAPFIGGHLPAISEFKQVLCHDLSLSGFSYLSDVAPNCEQVIVALGKSPFILMAARVVHHSPTVIDGVRSEIVGCQFVARIEPGTASSAATVVKYDFATSGLPNRLALVPPWLGGIFHARAGWGRPDGRLRAYRD